jgi:hypothetical protein
MTLAFMSCIDCTIFFPCAFSTFLLLYFFLFSQIYTKLDHTIEQVEYHSEVKERARDAFEVGETSIFPGAGHLGNNQTRFRLKGCVA